MKRSILLLGTALVSACATSPAANMIAGEPAEIFAEAPEAPTEWVAAGVAGTPPTGDWITQFGDETMEGLIAEALAKSPTLEAQTATVRAAYAQRRAAMSAGKPQVNGSASAGGTSRIFEFANFLGGSFERQTDPVYGIGIDASWEFDLWNRIAASIDEADANLLASEADLAAAQLSISTQTAISWVNLNAALAQERVAVQTYEARQRVMLLTERRFQRGLTGALDVRTARSAVAGAEAAIAARRQASGEAARRLEVLVGRYPSAEIVAPAVLPVLETISVEGNPALLLARRPDIAASEARVVAAGLRAEQARLAILPRLTLTGSARNNEFDLEDALDPERLAVQLVAGLAGPIFAGGRLDAQRDAAIAQAEASVANYAASALTAWREVEDALAADTLLARQEDAQIRALEEARLAEELAERSYTSGTVAIFNLIDAQTRRLNSESQLVSARANRAINRISYHLALGGGVPVPPAIADLSSPDLEPQTAATRDRS